MDKTTVILTLEDLDTHVEDLYDIMTLDDWCKSAKEVHDQMDTMVQRFVKTFSHKEKTDEKDR